MQQANSPISIDFGVRDWCPILFTITKLLGINISCIREYTWKLPWLRTLLHERGIQTSCDGKAKKKAELAELAVNAPKMKLPKVSDGESENTNTVIAELLRTDEGVLATPALVNNWS